MMKDTQFTLRLDSELYRRLRFIAADRDVSLNELINRLLLEASANCRVSLPNDLIAPELTD